MWKCQACEMEFSDPVFPVHCRCGTTWLTEDRRQGDPIECHNPNCERNVGPQFPFKCPCGWKYHYEGAEAVPKLKDARGLGDVVAITADMLGIRKTPNCNCGKRQIWLNNVTGWRGDA